LDVLDESVEALFPSFRVRVPSPPRERVQTLVALRVEGLVGVPPTLPGDPRSKPVSIDDGPLRHAGIPVTFDVFDESAKTFLPLVCVRVPGPAVQILESEPSRV
jgi:hypothetical protein